MENKTLNVEPNAVLNVLLNAELGECGGRMWNCIAFNGKLPATSGLRALHQIKKCEQVKTWRPDNPATLNEVCKNCHNFARPRKHLR